MISGGMQHLLVVACGVLLPDQESHLGPLLREHRVLVAGPPAPSLFIHFYVFAAPNFRMIKGSLESGCRKRRQKVHLPPKVNGDLRLGSPESFQGP